MLDIFKDSAEAWLQRVRSPILGSAALLFFAINWKPIWYLVFADKPVLEKLDYFDTNTSEHPHFFWEDTGELTDASTERMEITNLPSAPQDAQLASADAVIRLRLT